MAWGTFEEHAQLQIVGTEAEAGRLKQGLDHALELLAKDPLHVGGLTLGSYCLRRLGAAVQAYHFAQAGVREAPMEDALWLSLGAACHDLWLIEEAGAAYRQALRYAKNDKHKACVWLNLAGLHIDNGEFAEGEAYVEKILEVIPDHRNAHANLGFCQLARHEWAPGWKNMAYSIGCDWRPKVVYNDEPEWDGSPDKVVALYEDQGLGDAISFASMLPDAAKVAKKVILDCEPKLYRLFERSFPTVKVYPTRRETGISGGLWDKEDRHVEASYPLGQLGEFFRTKDEDFPGTPYLVACPVRTEMWDRHFESLGKPVIGIAWTGGVPRTNARFRQLTLKQLLPILSAVDAHWVCLQYKDAAKEIAAFRVEHPEIDLMQYPWATLTKDYDDTAALVSSLDRVICMQTAVGHAAAALGVPVTVLVPKATTWRYGSEGETIPWYRSMRIVRQARHGEWENEIDSVAQRLRADNRLLPAGARETPREGQLRRDGRGIRANGERDHRALGSHASP